MTHEPECPWRFEDDCYVVAAGVTFCEVIRSGYQRGREDAAKAIAVLEPTQDYGFLRLWRDEAIVAARGEVRGDEFLFTPRVDEAKKHGRADNLIRTSNPPKYLCICGEFHTISAARGDGEQA